jgi:hypothetical protein
MIVYFMYSKCWSFKCIMAKGLLKLCENVGVYLATHLAAVHILLTSTHTQDDLDQEYNWYLVEYHDGCEMSSTFIPS